MENQLYQIDGVADAVVVGIPHKIYGETPVALIRLEKGARLDEEGIREYLNSRMAKYKIPSRIMFTDEIPLTPNGKVDKKRIRTMF